MEESTFGVFGQNRDSWKSDAKEGPKPWTAVQSDGSVSQEALIEVPAYLVFSYFDSV